MPKSKPSTTPSTEKNGDTAPVFPSLPANFVCVIDAALNTLPDQPLASASEPVPAPCAVQVLPSKRAMLRVTDAVLSAPLARPPQAVSKARRIRCVSRRAAFGVMPSSRSRPRTPSQCLPSGTGQHPVNGNQPALAADLGPLHHRCPSSPRKTAGSPDSGRASPGAPSFLDGPPLAVWAGQATPCLASDLPQTVAARRRPERC